VQAIPLGRVNVPNAGTPVALSSVMTAAQTAMLSTAGQCAKIEAWPDPAAAGKVFIKQGGVTLAALPVPSGGYPIPWSTPECDHNCISPTAFQIDAATNGDGAFVTVWVE
jgi:hypothetical protein